MLIGEQGNVIMSVKQTPVGRRPFVQMSSEVLSRPRSLETNKQTENKKQSLGKGMGDEGWGLEMGQKKRASTNGHLSDLGHKMIRC